MPKYGDIIKQAKSGKPDNQTPGLPDNQTTRKPESLASDSRLDSQAVKPDNQTTRQPDSQTDKSMSEPMKNLCVKVPEAWRRHWAAQAKLSGRTMTDVMVEALTQEFGLPDNQITR
jgi:hypothetical protein